MAKIYAGKANFIPAATTKTVHTGAGKLRSIVVAATANSTVSIYDNTSASNALLALCLLANTSLEIHYPTMTPLTFDTGLTVVTPANCTCHVVTEF